MNDKPNGQAATIEFPGDFHLLQGIVDRARAANHAEMIQVIKGECAKHWAEANLNEKIRLEVERVVGKALADIPQNVACLLPLQVEHALNLYMEARKPKPKAKRKR